MGTSWGHHHTGIHVWASDFFLQLLGGGGALQGALEVPCPPAGPRTAPRISTCVSSCAAPPELCSLPWPLTPLLFLEYSLQLEITPDS